jgi:Flp pilus assembly CpaF family ATPase
MAQEASTGKAVSAILREAQNVIESSLFGLKAFLDDPRVNEIMINHRDSVFVERAGDGIIAIDRTQHKLRDSDILLAISAIMKLNGKDTAMIMDARLEGLRVAAALPPVAIHGPALVIRKHSARVIPLETYVASGAFDVAHEDLRRAESAASAADRAKHEAMAAEGGDALRRFLRWAVRSHANILICGGTSSGKTTLAASCLAEIPPEERIITCEDTHEILLTQPNVLQFEALPGIDGRPEVSIRHLIKMCLRSRPDRIIVGEIRGPEAYDFLDAMNTGHSGSICTIHANSSAHGLSRLESLIRMSPTAANLPLLSMRSEIASAIHYVVYQSRVGGTRAPQEVLALDGVADDGQYRKRLLFRKAGVSDA